MENTEKQYKQLSAEERAMIVLMSRDAKGVREIGRFLNRSPGAISREMDRDFGEGNKAPRGKPRGTNCALQSVFSQPSPQGAGN